MMFKLKEMKKFKQKPEKRLDSVGIYLKNNVCFVFYIQNKP